MNRAGKSSVSVELMLAGIYDLEIFTRLYSTSIYCFHSQNVSYLPYLAKAGSHSSNECPPSFSQPLTDVDVNEGSRARFECKVDARPKPTVEWMKVGWVTVNRL